MEACTCHASAKLKASVAEKHWLTVSVWQTRCRFCRRWIDWLDWLLEFCRRAVASMEIEVFLLRAVLVVIGTTYCKLNFQCVQALQTLRSKYPYHFLLLIWSVGVAVCKRCFPVMAELSAAMLALGQPHPELCTELPMIHVTELRVEKVSCSVEQIGFAYSWIGLAFRRLRLLCLHWILLLELSRSGVVVWLWVLLIEGHHFLLANWSLPLCSTSWPAPRNPANL